MIKQKRNIQANEIDSVYFLKLVIYLVFGSFWVRIMTSEAASIPIPMGLILGLLLIKHERFQIDKKIEYAILLITSFVAFWLPLGVEVRL